MKTLYEIGEVPPLGEVPETMYASVIRKDRFGPPEQAFDTEVVPTPTPGRGQVLVYMMAAGINYNNVWSALGKPIDVIEARQRNGAAEDFHIGGSEGSGVVWAVGAGVESVAVGDHVVLSGCMWNESATDIRLGTDPMMSRSQVVWGYEENYGAFGQFALVDDYQCLPKPRRLSWDEAAAFLLTGATAYRQLCGWPPNVVRPGDPVLIWGGSGGLGSMAIQITAILGGIPIPVVSSSDRSRYCVELGAKGSINRRDFDHWGPLPDPDDGPAVDAWTRGARSFGKKFWEVLGERKNPRIVLEHTGRDTIPTSMYLCDNGGMVVLCGGTTGYQADVDLRFLWMRQKRLQGSHFANLRHCREVISLVDTGLLEPCLTWCGSFESIGKAHQLMYNNEHPGGNMAVLINAPEEGATGLNPR